MKRPLFVIGGVVLILAGAFFWGVRSTNGGTLVGQDVRLVIFTMGSPAKGLLYIPFEGDTDASTYATVYLGNQTIADGISIRPRKGGRVGIPVTITTVPKVGEGVKIKLTASKDSQTFSRPLAEVTTGPKDVLDLGKTTIPELSMKGIFADIVYAQVTEAARVVPDIQQQLAECAPTAAADSLISLAREHNMGDNLPAIGDLITELKGDMQWTLTNGVLPQNFVKGKDRWAAKHKLPVHTKIVGDVKGKDALQGILEGMAKGGGAAELRIRFDDANGKTIGGHMVSVSAVRVEDDRTFIEVSDPRTPEGSDTYEVAGDTIIGYPVDGSAHISFGFVQTWGDATASVKQSPAGNSQVAAVAAPVKRKMKVIQVGSHEIPLSSVYISNGAGCDARHYRPNTGSAIAIDGTRLKDPGGCGYGKVKDIPSYEIDR